MGPNVQLDAEQVEAQRRYLLEEAKKLKMQQRELERSRREQASAMGHAPVSRLPGRLRPVGYRGKNLAAELERAGRSGSHLSSVHTPRPVYETPAMNMRAAEAAAAELSGLEGEERERQQQRVNELIRAANRQQAAKAARTSQHLHSAASSPQQPKEKSVTSARNKQIQPYDPVLAGKQKVDEPNAAQGSRGVAPNVPRARSAGAAQPRPQTHNQQPRAQCQHQQQPQYQAQPRYYAEQQQVQPRQNQTEVEDLRAELDKAADLRAGNPLGNRIGVRESDLWVGNPLGDRIGIRQLDPNDARNRLDKLRIAQILEEQGAPGPKCFGPRIMREPPPGGNRAFELPRKLKTYDGSTKPEDWLESYLLAMEIAGGNRRVARKSITNLKTITKWSIIW